MMYNNVSMILGFCGLALFALGCTAIVLGPDNGIMLPGLYGSHYYPWAAVIVLSGFGMFVAAVTIDVLHHRLKQKSKSIKKLKHSLEMKKQAIIAIGVRKNQNGT